MGPPEEALGSVGRQKEWEKCGQEPLLNGFQGEIGKAGQRGLRLSGFNNFSLNNF